MKTPKRVNQMYLEATCVGITINEWHKLYDHGRRANKRQIHKLVKEHLPDLYEELNLHLYNPYNYFKTPTHLIIVHSAIEYFIRFE